MTGIFSSPVPRVFSIDAGRPFLMDLARTLKAEAANALALADCLIFVPTRRAQRALAEAFAEISGEAALLPKIRALGDVEEEALAIDAAMSGTDFDLAPAASALERRLVLARLAAEAERRFSGQESWPAALAAADALDTLVESLYTEEIDISRLKTLAPEAHAAHWRVSLDFLKIVTEIWPNYLKAQDIEDPSRRRVALIDRQGRMLAEKDPGTPVIVAGTTGSAPAVARLMKVVSRLTKGAVALPGFDFALGRDLAGWNAVDDPHPQAGIKAALAAIDVAPEDVRPWPGSGGLSPRARLFSLALRPAEATDDWLPLVRRLRAEDSGLERGLEGLTLIEAADEDEEAAAIALLFRETLETPGRCAMLVTPDRHLGRRVAARMTRWGVKIEDTGGVPLANAPIGVFLRLVAEWLARPTEPVALISLLRHPLALLGFQVDERARALAALTRRLRAPAPVISFDVFMRELAADTPALAPLCALLHSARGNYPAAAPAPISDFLDAQIAAAEAVAGGEGLWRGADGAAASALLSDVRVIAPALGSVGTADYPEVFARLIAGKALRASAGAHPRLAIMGPLEARLQTADLVILGGLNEGQWPGEPEIDPFLSRDMRRRIGLPTPERRVGLQAHDFAGLAAAPEVALTRARKRDGAPAKPSRWIVRLQNIMKGADAAPEESEARRWAGLLDRPADFAPASPPAPKPPVAARPRGLSVTQIETLLRDPYSVYGQFILKLRPVDPIGGPPGANHLGMLFHKIFEEFTKEGATGGEPRLRALLLAHAPRYGFGPAALALWRLRFDAALKWFLDFGRERQAAGAVAHVEASGEAAFTLAGAPFALKARADRIEVVNGEAVIFDYKTGKPPTLSQIDAGFSPQLPLTALILEAGGFKDIGAARVSGFSYLRALSRKEGGADDVAAIGADARKLIDVARQGLEALIASFDDPQTPYLSQPRPQFERDYARFDRLARRREWAIEGEET